MRRTNHQPDQPRRRARPEPEDTLLGEDPVAAMEGVAVLLSRRQGLHARFDDTGREETLSRGDGVDVEARTYSSGIVVYTVTRPAIAPIPKVILEGSCCPGRAVLCTNCLSVVYVVKRTAEFAPA